MANPAPTINQINAFNATQGTTIDFNIIGGTELVRSNRIYIYDLSDNSLICTHLYVSTESIHELPANTDGSILYADGKSSADFVNGAQYYAQIQTFTDIAGTEGGSGLSVAKMFWCLVDPTLTITTIPSTISTTSYNISATYNANTSVVSNIIQQYQFNLYSATGSLLQSSGVVVGNGEQQGTSTTYDISYNFTGLSVGSSYYVTVEVMTTQGMSINTQSNTFTVSIDTPTLGEATVVNNACDGYISVTSNLSGEYGGSGSGEIVSFETDSENVFTKLQVDLEPVQEGTPWVSASETEPYLMRISPQLGHDYNTEFDTLVGGTVAWNQLVKNGNFASGTTNWTGVNASISASNGELTISANGASEYNAGQLLDFHANHVYLIDCSYYSHGNEWWYWSASYSYSPAHQLVADAWNPFRAVIKTSADKQKAIFTGRPNISSGAYLKLKNVVHFDLTQMFGSTVADAIYAMEQAHAGDGVAFFRKYFPKAYYAYDAGTLMSVKTSSHDTAGKNWLAPWFSTQTKYGVTWTVNADGTFTSSGTASQNSSQIVTSNIVLPDGTYIISGCPTGGSGSTYYLRALLYDSNNTLIDQWSDFGSGKTFTIDSATTAYIKVFVSVNNGQTAPSGTWKPMIRVSSANADFEPYTKNTYPLDPNLELRGLFKLENSKLKADGDVYSSSGNVQRKYGIVDLGTLNWGSGTSTVGTWFMSDVIQGIKPNASASTLANALCSKYDQYSYVTLDSLTKGFSVIWSASTASGRVYFKDSAYSSAEAFKTAMSGVYLVYEKATVTTETAMPFEANQSIIPNGSEEYIDSRTVPIPVGHLTSYADVYPITGHDDVGVSVVGKNLLDTKLYKGISYYPTVGSTPTIIENLTQLTDNGDGTFSIMLTTSYQSIDFIVPIKKGVQYHWKTKIESNGTEHGVSYGYLDESHKILSRYNDTALSKQFDVTLSQDNYLTGDNGYFYVAISDRSSAGATITITQPQLELGTTATTYEPYQGQFYHQDIEATYTPTVQENEAYLFKQTGDVGGDRETIELVGGTVAWNQLVKNGNFANTNDWSGGTIATFSVSNNVAEIITSNVYGRIRNTTPFSIKANHKYLINGAVKCSVSSTQARLMVSDYDTSGSVWAKSTSATDWTDLTSIFNATETADRYVLVGTLVSASTIYARNIMLIDLTQMFGSTIADYIYSIETATAGAGVAFFRNLFPKPYYEYNAGELISVKTSAHKTVGFNQWDEVWEVGGISATGNNYPNTDRIRSKNYIPVIPNTGYYLQIGTATYGMWLWGYDANKNYVGRIPSNEYAKRNQVVQIPSDVHYIRIVIQQGYGTTYNNDICINISDSSKNGTYEPYTGNTYPLDADLELRGMLKLDISNKLYYDGDTYKNDGSVNRKFGQANLGLSTWNYHSASQTFYAGYNAVGMKPSGGIMCAKYPVNNETYTNLPDKSMSSNSSGFSSSAYIFIKDSSFNGDATALKASLSGVIAYFELATPTTETADAFEEIQKVTPIYGTEEYADSRTVPMPVYTKTQYLTRDVYGGYIDFVNGLLMVKWKYAPLSNTWAHNSSGGGIIYFQNASYQDIINLDTNNDTETRVACDGIKCGSGYQALRGATYPFTMGVISNKRLYIGVPIADFPDSTAFNRFIENANLHICYELAEPMIFQLTPQQIQTLIGVNNVWSEQGEISLAYHIPITNLLVKRQDVADVSGSWLTLHSQPITQASDMDFTFIDFTNQYGKTYKYALVPLLTQTQSGVEVEVEGGYTVSDEVQSVFDGVFIVDSTGSQKCKANVGYGNVDMNQTVGTITPIGAKYPVVITNSKNQYHNGSISGTIVPDDYYFNGNLSRIDMVNKRDELEQFLTNKRAKIIKDWNGKIWLVMIMDNVSCTFNNNYGMGIVNFSTNWVEVGDPTNQQDLQATGLIDVGGA